MCAVPEEFRAVKRIFSLVDGSLDIRDDPTTYLRGRIDGNRGIQNVVAAQAAEQGMPVTSALVTKMVCRFRPGFVAMPGIAAGLSDELMHGDVLFAEQTWDYTTGKATIDKSGTPAVRPENRGLRVDPTVLEQMRQRPIHTRCSAVVRNRPDGHAG